jgi:crossover junction endodeoxyribonuclease RusA
MGISLSLPYPPSINHYWRRNRFRGMHVSNEGKSYRAAVVDLLAGRYGGSGVHEVLDKIEACRLAVHLRINPPDRRRRDIDNVQKPLLDALQHGGLYADDEQIDWLLTERGEVDRSGGQALVTIEDRSALTQCEACKGTGWKAER